MLRVLIASPYPAMRVGLHALLEDAGRGVATVVGEADSVEVALEWTRATQPQVVFFDLALDPDDELSGLWRLRQAYPSAAVLALADSNRDSRMLTALQAGARGCLPKTATGPELIEAAQGILDGEPILPASATAALLEQLRGDRPTETLTPRESEVLRHVAAGLTNKAIALRLGISEHTVKFHLGSAMSKLGAASRAEAVAVAMRRGLISV
ncbi:MAG TPA: response regulator transcription factor [Anaerolineales bacterium]|nr:response regulator transcription factor [Anaerolineales bacterium]